MTPKLLLALYGAIVIGGVFLVVSFARLAILEAWKRKRAVLRSVYFWLSANQAAQAFFIGVICTTRAVDVLSGAGGAVALSGGQASSHPWVLVGSFAGLLITKTGFNYATTMVMKRGKLVWRLLLVATLSWWVFVALWVGL